MLVALIIIFVIAYLWGKVIFSDQNTSNSSSSSSYNYQATHSTIESETPSSNDSSHSNWYEDDNDYSELSATVSYSVMDAPEEECDLDNLSDRDLRRLKAADDNGEYLDSDYISEHMNSIHNKIIEAIREDLELKSGDPHDGMVEVHHPPAYWGWEKVRASHLEMSLADEYEIEYTVDVY